MAAFDPLLALCDPTQPLIGIEDVKKRASPGIRWLDCQSNNPQHLFGNLRRLMAGMRAYDQGNGLHHRLTGARGLGGAAVSQQVPTHPGHTVGQGTELPAHLVGA